MTPSPTPTARIASIDIMRGAVIMLMMLDHVRERFYMHVRTGDPIYDTIEPDLFFTRLLTHFCAPVFIFLAGVSAWLFAHPAGQPFRSPSGFLLKRGLVIVLIEVVLYRLLWIDSYPIYLFLQVLFAIGACMIALSAAVHLPYRVIGTLGLLIVFGHNALEPIQFAPGDFLYPLWTVLHDGGKVMELAGLTVSLSYPVLPWFGVILLGYFAGPLFARNTPSTTRRRALLVIGASCLALLLVLRGFNLYGETLPWAAGETLLRSVMSFVNYTKYPPSLDYLLLTLGIAMLALAWLDTVKRPNKVLAAVEAFGSVPMFLYVVHLYVLLAAYWVLFATFGANHGERFGLDSVGWIWVGAIALILAHYPLAHWFAAYKHKEKTRKPWLSYF